MKFLLIFLASLLTATPALAEWVFITKTPPPDGHDFYYEPSRIVKLDNVKEAWILLNAQTPRTTDKGVEKSTALKIKFDCKREYYDITYSIYYSEPNGAGKPFETLNFEGSKNARMEPVPINSAWDTVMKRICK